MVLQAETGYGGQVLKMIPALLACLCDMILCLMLQSLRQQSTLPSRLPYQDRLISPETVSQNQSSLPSVASVRFVTVAGEVANVEPFKPHMATYPAKEQPKRLRTDHTLRAMHSETD